jgi:hypothetical protein
MGSVVAAAVGTVLGIALGWFIRPMVTWCPACGGALKCSRCQSRPAILPVSDRPVALPADKQSVAISTTGGTNE